MTELRSGRMRHGIETLARGPDPFGPATPLAASAHFAPSVAAPWGSGREHRPADPVGRPPPSAIRGRQRNCSCADTVDAGSA
jgi:hypothetical protein